jgi:hypothetical protein
MSSSIFSEAQQHQYYTFNAPNRIQRSLHVIDADYGVFESRQKSKNNILLSPKKLMKKLKVSKTNNVERISLSSSDDLNLRPEPELIDSGIYKSRYNNSPYKLDNKFSNYDSDYDSDDTNSLFSTLSSSSEIESMPQSRGYYKSQNRIPVLAESSLQKNTSSKVAHKSNSRPKSKLMASKKGIPIESDNVHKCQIEMEYDKMKLRAARYQAERDAIRIKMQKKEVANKLREYEYYCVNGIDHNRLDPNIVSSNDNKLQIPYFQRKSLLLDQSWKKKSKGKNQLETFKTLENDIICKISQLLPTEVLLAIDPYTEYIPSTDTVRMFHKEVYSWINSIPVVSMLGIIIKLLGLLIPKKSARSWSVRAIIVGIVDLLILSLGGWMIYTIFWTVYRFLNTFYLLARMLRII